MTTSIVSETPTTGPDQQAPIAATRRFFSIDDVTDALDAGGFDWKSDTYVVQAQCPAHDGGGLALKIEMGEDSDGEERLLMRCWSHDCDFMTIVRALRHAAAGELKSTRDLEKSSGGGKGNSSSGRSRSGRAPWEREHLPITKDTYVDIFGKYLFHKEKFVFTDEEGGKDYLVKPKGGAVPVFYHAPALEAARKAGGTVWWVEGEKDANTLKVLGITAITTHQGGKASRDTALYIAQLKGIGHVVIAADRDLVGYKFALRIHAAMSEAGIESSIRRTTLDIPKADVSDHLEAGLELDDMEILTADDLRELIAGAEDSVEAQTETADFSFGGINETPEEAAASFGEVADEGGDDQVAAQEPVRMQQARVRVTAATPFTAAALEQAAKLELNDLGLGARIGLYGAGRFAHRSKLGWYRYDGTVWHLTESLDAIKSFARSVIRTIKSEANLAVQLSSVVDAARKAVDVAKSGGDDKEISATVAALKGVIAGIHRSYEDFYRQIANGRSHIEAGIEASMDILGVDELLWLDDPRKLNVLNGVVDLRDGSLAPHDYREYLTKITGVAYYKGAHHVDLDTVLEGMRTSAGDDIPAFLRRWYGQCATGLMTGRSFLYMFGAQGAGKTTLLNAVFAALGGASVTSYAASSDPSVFAKRPNRDSKRDDLHSLMGIRFLFIDEAEEGTIDSAGLKKQTGGGSNRTRENFGRFIEWFPMFKANFAGNGLMGIPTDDAAFMRRWIPIHMKYTVVSEDGMLLHRLEHGKEQREATLAWMVAGAGEWLAAGGDERALAAPTSVDSERKRVAADHDDLGNWLAGFVVPEGTVHNAITGTDLHKLYVRHQKDQNIIFTMTPAKFRTALEVRGYKAGSPSYRTVHGKRKTGRWVDGLGTHIVLHDDSAVALQEEF